MTDVTSDLDGLIRNTTASDPLLSQALVETYYAYIYRLSLSILGDESEADDAAQETFIRALNNLHHYQAGTYLKGWLSTIAVNICRDALRRRKARQTLQGVLQAVGRITQHLPTPEESTLQNESSQILWQAVQTLSEKHRLPLILRFVQDMSIREIAQTLNLPEGTIQSRLHYAIRKLQDRLGSADGGQLGKSWTEFQNGGAL